MAVSDGYRAFVLEQLRRAAPVTARSMFGGIGLYADGLFFALIADDTLYFKVDDSNRPDYEAAGMGPFRPFGEGSTPMSYYAVPAEALEEPAALRSWVEQAIAVARAAAARRRSGGGRKRRK